MRVYLACSSTASGRLDCKGLVKGFTIHTSVRLEGISGSFLTGAAKLAIVTGSELLDTLCTCLLL